MSRRAALKYGVYGLSALALSQLGSLNETNEEVLPPQDTPDPNKILSPHALSMDIGWPIHPQLGWQLWSNEMIDRLYNNGIRWVRLIAYPEFKKGWTEDALGKMQAAVVSFYNRGIRPVVLLTQGSLTNEIMGSGDYEKEFIEKTAVPLVNTLGSRVAYWQLINEPNHSPTWYAPKDYARLVEMWRVQFGNSVSLATGSVLINWANWNTMTSKGAPGWLAAVLSEGKRLGWKEEALPFSRLTVQMYVDWYVKTTPERLANFILPTRKLLPLSIPMDITEIGWVRENSLGETTMKAALVQADNVKAVIDLGTKLNRKGQSYRQEVLNLNTVSFYCEGDHFFDNKLSTWGMYFLDGFVPDYMPETVRASRMTPSMAMFQTYAETFKQR